eukprot:jgi/Ulvmu1/3317/UM154_0009.1
MPVSLGPTTPPPDPAPPTPAPAPAPMPDPPDPVDSDGDLRLLDKVEINGYVTGGLQLSRDGAFGFVCNSLRNMEADVACRELGFVGGAALPQAAFSRPLTDPERQALEAPLAVVFDSLTCTGNEATLTTCSGGDGPFRDESCGFSGAAFIACGDEVGPDTGDLRLNDGETSDDGLTELGRLEVFNEGGWGVICDRFGRIRTFGEEEAQVACRALGFPGGTFISSMDTEDAAVSRLPTWLANLGCEGSESDLLACPSAALPVSTQAFCRAQFVTWVSCTSEPDIANGELQLVDQVEINGYVTGALQLFREGSSGFVCSLIFNMEAQVACSQLGFEGGGALPQGGFTRSLTESEQQEREAPLAVVFEDLSCTGTEARLVDCSQIEPFGDSGLDAFLDQSCSFSAEAFVACGTVSGPAIGDLRLTEGRTSEDGLTEFGRLEVFNEGGWGLVCDRIGRIRTFAEAEAEVACRALGFSGGTFISSMAPVGCVA